MPELGKATYFVTMNTADFTAGAAKVEATTKGMARTVESQTTRMGASFARMGRTALKFAGFAGVAALYFGIKAGTDIIKENDAALKQVTSAIKTTGGAANVTSKHVEEMALKWQRLTGIHAGVISGTEAMLLRFTAVRNEMGKGNNVFDRTVTAVMNINAAMGKGLKPTLVAVGKAIQDPAKYLGMLARSGITFTAAQTKMIKSLEATKGVLAAQKYVLSSLESRYNGAAKAAGQSFAGQLTRAKVAMQDNVAVVLRALIPSFIVLVKVLGTVAGFFARHQQLAKLLVLGFLALNAAAITYVVALKLATAATRTWTLVTKAATGVAWLFNAALDANPVVLITVAIVALGVGLYELYKHFDRVRAVVNKFTTALTTGLKQALGWVRSNWKTIAMLIAGPFAPLAVLAAKAFGVRDALLGAMRSLGRAVEREAERIGDAFWQGIKSGLGDIKSKLKDSIVDPIKGAFNDVRHFFGIGSPSRWTHEMIGKPLAQGISSGYVAELQRFTPRSHLVAALTPSVGLTAATRTVSASSAGAVGRARHSGGGSRSDAYTLLSRLPDDQIAAQAGFLAPRSQMISGILDSRGYATGGVVRGPSGRDRVPAWLTAGEVVLAEPEQKRLMRKIGIGGNAHTLFKAARGYATGGVVDFHHRGGEGGSGDPIGSRGFPSWAISAIVNWANKAFSPSRYKDYPMGRQILAARQVQARAEAKVEAGKEQQNLRGQGTDISVQEQHALDVGQRGMDLAKKGSQAWRKAVTQFIDAEDAVIADLSSRMARSKSPSLRAKLYAAISTEMKNRADAQAQLADQAKKAKKKTAKPDVSYATQQDMAEAKRSIDLADAGTRAWAKGMRDYISAEGRAITELQKLYDTTKSPERRRELYDQISTDLKDKRDAEQTLADAADTKRMEPLQHAVDVAQRGIDMNPEGSKKWKAGMRAYIAAESNTIDELQREWKAAKTPEKRDELYREITTEMNNRREAQKQLKTASNAASTEWASYMTVRGSFFSQFASNVFQSTPGGYRPGAKTHPNGYATGGIAPGRGNGDTVPAMLTPGEVVLNRRSQQGLGRRLGMPGAGPHALFNAIQRFAHGGPVHEQTPNLLTATLDRFPLLRRYADKIAFRQFPSSTGDDRGSEFYPPGERGSFAPRKHAVAAFGSGSRPLDLAGEFVSHWLARGTDPFLSRNYRDFGRSLTPFQGSVLHEQYDWSRTHEHERRPFSTWKQVSGLPAYYRGAAFGQWPGHSDLYTRAQRRSLSAVEPYLRGVPQHFAGGGVVKFKDLPDTEKVRRIEAGYRAGRMTQDQAYKAVRFWHLTALWGDTHGGYDLPGKVAADAKSVVDPRGYVALAKQAYHHPVGTAKMLGKGQYEWYRHPLRSLKEHPLLGALSVVPLTKAAAVAGSLTRGEVSVAEAVAMARTNLAQRPSARAARGIGHVLRSERGSTTVGGALLGIDRLLSAGPLRQISEKDLRFGPSVGRGVNNPAWARAVHGQHAGRTFIVKPLYEGHDIASELLGSMIYEQAGIPGAQNWLTSMYGGHAIASLQIPGAHHYTQRGVMRNKLLRDRVTRGSMLDTLVGYGDQHFGNIVFDREDVPHRIDFSGTLMGRHSYGIHSGSPSLKGQGYGVGHLSTEGRLAEIQMLHRRLPPSVIEYLVNSIPDQFLDPHRKRTTTERLNTRLISMLERAQARHEEVRERAHMQTATAAMAEMARAGGGGTPGLDTIFDVRHGAWRGAGTNTLHQHLQDLVFAGRNVGSFLEGSTGFLSELGIDRPISSPRHVLSTPSFPGRSTQRREAMGAWTRDDLAAMQSGFTGWNLGTKVSALFGNRRVDWEGKTTGSRRNLVAALKAVGVTIQHHLRRSEVTDPHGGGTDTRRSAYFGRLAEAIQDQPAPRSYSVNKRRYATDTRINEMFGQGTSQEALHSLVDRTVMPGTATVRGAFGLATPIKVAQIRSLIRTLRREQGSARVDVATLGLGRLLGRRERTATAPFRDATSPYSARGASLDDIVRGDAGRALRQRTALAPPRGADAAWIRPVRGTYSPPVKRGLRGLLSRLGEEHGHSTPDSMLFGLPGLIYKRTHGGLLVGETAQLSEATSREIVTHLKAGIGGSSKRRGRAFDKLGHARESIAREALEEHMWGHGSNVRVYRNDEGRIQGLMTYLYEHGGEFSDVYAAGHRGFPMFHDFIDHARKHRAAVHFTSTLGAAPIYEKLGFAAVHRNDVDVTRRMVRMLSRDPLVFARHHRRTGTFAQDIPEDVLREMAVTSRRQGMGARVASLLKSERGSARVDVATLGASRLFGGKKFTVKEHEGIDDATARSLAAEIGMWPHKVGLRNDARSMATQAIKEGRTRSDYDVKLREYRDEKGALTGLLDYRADKAQGKPMYRVGYAGAPSGGLDMFKDFIGHAARNKAGISWGSTSTSRKLYEALGGQASGGIGSFMISPREVRILNRDIFGIARWRKLHRGLVPDTRALHALEKAGRQEAAVSRRDRLVEPISKYLGFWHEARGYGESPYQRGRRQFREGVKYGEPGAFNFRDFPTPDEVGGLVKHARSMHKDWSILPDGGWRRAFNKTTGEVSPAFEGDTEAAKWLEKMGGGHAARDKRAYALGLLRASREHYADRELPPLNALSKRQFPRELGRYMEFWRVARLGQHRPYGEAWEKLGFDVKAEEDTQRARDALMWMRYPNLRLAEHLKGNTMPSVEAQRYIRHLHSEGIMSEDVSRGLAGGLGYGAERKQSLLRLLATAEGRGGYRVPTPRPSAMPGSTSGSLHGLFPGLAADPNAVMEYLAQHATWREGLHPNYRRAVNLSRGMGVPMSPAWMKMILAHPYKIPKGTIEGFALGGVVRGVESLGDRIPALLKAGEVILNKRHQQSLAASMGMQYTGPDDFFYRVQQIGSRDVSPNASLDLSGGDPQKIIEYHQHNTFHEMPRDRHALARQMRQAVEGALA